MGDILKEMLMNLIISIYLEIILLKTADSTYRIQKIFNAYKLQQKWINNFLENNFKKALK